MRKSLWLFALLPCLAMAQMTVGVWTLTPGSVAPGGGGGGGGTPGGNDGDWQINSGGSFGGVTPASGWDMLFSTPSSENLGAWLTDETGSGGGGLAVFNSSPTIISPTLTGTTTVTTANVTTVNVTTLQPATNDGASLGSTSRQFSDLFLAEGGVINWDAGDATLTQAGNVVTLASAGLTIADTTSLLLGTAGSAVGNIGFRNATSGTITLAPTTGALGTVTLTLPAATDTLVGRATTDSLSAKIVLQSASLGTDDTYEASSAITGLLAGATIAQWEAVYVGGSSTYLLADANGSSTYPARGLAVAAYSSTNPAIIVTRGTVRNDAWNWTPGGTIYLSGTPGALTQTAPSTSGDKVQAIGYALTADIAFFDFDSTYVTVQ